MKHTRALSIIAITALLMSGPLAVAGGWSSSGGGSGVACFATELLARQAAKELQTVGAFSSKTLQAMTSVEALDYHEASLLEKKSLEAFAGSRPTLERSGASNHLIIYAHMMNRMKRIYPEAALTLNRVHEDLTSKPWQANHTLQLVEDFGPTPDVAANCERVQLLLRHSKQKAGAKLHKNLPAPEGLIEFNPTLWEKLDPLNRAMLLVHESLYATSQTYLGHSDSAQIRVMVRKLFEAGY